MCLRCAVLGLGKVLREIKCWDIAKSVTDRREIRAADTCFVRTFKNCICLFYYFVDSAQFMWYIIRIYVLRRRRSRFCARSKCGYEKNDFILQKYFINGGKFVVKEFLWRRWYYEAIRIDILTCLRAYTKQSFVRLVNG